MVKYIIKLQTKQNFEAITKPKILAQIKWLFVYKIINFAVS